MSSALVASFDAMQALRILLKLEEAPDSDTSYLRRLVLADAKRNIAVPAAAPLLEEASVDAETAEAVAEEAAADEATEAVSEDAPDDAATAEAASEDAPDDAEVTEAESDDAEVDAVEAKKAPKKASAKA